MRKTVHPAAVLENPPIGWVGARNRSGFRDPVATSCPNVQGNLGLTRTSGVARLKRSVMTRNPNVPLMSVRDPIKVALLTDDPLLRAGVSSLLSQLGHIDVVDQTGAEVALWDA